MSHRGIKANLKKIRVIVEMKSPRMLKGIKCLVGKLAALNRFISKAIDKCHVFFQVMRNEKKAEWKLECEEAFQQLKEYLSRPRYYKPLEEEICCIYTW